MDSLIDRLRMDQPSPEIEIEAAARIEKLEKALQEIMDFRPKAIGGYEYKIARTALEQKP